jgi:hypothetical protein
MVTKIDPGELYFITSLDPISGKSQGFYKIGIVRNLRETAERIKEHQTGNPHRVVPYEVLKTEAPLLIEQILHGKYRAKQMSTEWFKFTDSERDDAIKEAKKLEKIHGPTLKALRPLYHKSSTKSMLTLTGAALKNAKKLLDEAYNLEVEVKKSYYLMKAAEHKLKTLNADNGEGIAGVTSVKFTPKKEGFNFAEWKSKATKAQKKKCEKPQKVDTTFELLYPKSGGKKATEGHWKTLHAAESKDEADEKKKIPKHLPSAFNRSGLLKRTKKIEDLHEIYCDQYGKNNLRKKELEAKILQIMMICKEHKGIDKICNWERKAQGPEVNESLMKQHFPADLTDKKFFKETKEKATISVYSFRPYV